MIDVSGKQMRKVVHGIHGRLVHAAAQLPPVALGHSIAMSLASFGLVYSRSGSVVHGVRKPWSGNSVRWTNNTFVET